MRRLTDALGRLVGPKVKFQLPEDPMEHPMENFFNEAAVADEAAVAGSYSTFQGFRMVHGVGQHNGCTLESPKYAELGER